MNQFILNVLDQKLVMECYESDRVMRVCRPICYIFTYFSAPVGSEPYFLEFEPQPCVGKLDRGISSSISVLTYFLEFFWNFVEVWSLVLIQPQFWWWWPYVDGLPKPIRPTNLLLVGLTINLLVKFEGQLPLPNPRAPIVSSGPWLVYDRELDLPIEPCVGYRLGLWCVICQCQMFMSTSGNIVCPWLTSGIQGMA